MPTVSKGETIMRAQALSPEKAKTLLNYLTASYGNDGQFIKILHAGLKQIDKEAPNA